MRSERGEPSVEYVIAGSGSDVAVEVLDEAEKIAQEADMTARKVVGTATYEWRYITYDAIYKVAYRENSNFDSINYVPAGTDIKDTSRFVKIVIPERGKTYLVYIPPAKAT